MAGGCISEEEYLSWEPVPQALGRVTGAVGRPGEAAVAIVQRLRAGHLVAAAEYVTEVGSSNAPISYVTVPKEYWLQSWTSNSSSSFWRTSQMELTFPGHTLNSKSRTITYFGLRFEPTDLQKLIAPKVVRQPPPEARKVISSVARFLSQPDPFPPLHRTKNQRKRISDDKLTAWYRARRAQFPGEVHRIVKQEAEAHFGEGTVGKNQLYRVMRAVSGGLNPGNPLISRKRPAN